MWIVLGFLGLGFLIGNIVGMTAESVVTSLLGLLFAFAGGSVLSLMHKLDVADRKLTGQAILSLSLSCLLGLYTGIVVSERRLLSPAVAATAPPAQAMQPAPAATPASPPPESKPQLQAREALIPSAAKKYLLSLPVSQVDQIDELRQSGKISPEEAYRRLHELVMKSEKEQP